MSPPKTDAAAVADAAPTAPRRSILRLISRLRMEVMDALDAELAPFEITSAQMIVLGTIASGEADSASGLCKGISYDPGAMTRMIDRLEQKGLLRRLPRADDRRTQSLELTPEGKALYPKLAETKESVQRRFLRGFSQDEERMLEGLLNRMIANR
jgi:DNA-binding MarR family transcriptional regulator